MSALLYHQIQGFLPMLCLPNIMMSLINSGTFKSVSSVIRFLWWWGQNNLHFGQKIIILKGNICILWICIYNECQFIKYWALFRRKIAIQRQIESEKSEKFWWFLTKEINYESQILVLFDELIFMIFTKYRVSQDMLTTSG